MTLRPANVSTTPPLAVKMQLRRAPTKRSGAAGQGTPTSGRHARERETSAHDAAPCQRAFPTTSHPGWRAKRSAGLRPASRGSAKPALMTLPPANVNSPPPPIPAGARNGAPVSGRHARERETSANDAAPCQREFPTTSHPGWRERSAGLRPASRGSAKPALMTLRPTNVNSPPRPIPDGARNGAPVSDRHRAGARNQRS